MVVYGGSRCSPGRSVMFHGGAAKFADAKKTAGPSGQQEVLLIRLKVPLTKVKTVVIVHPHVQFQPIHRKFFPSWGQNNPINGQDQFSFWFHVIVDFHQ